MMYEKTTPAMWIKGFAATVILVGSLLTVVVCNKFNKPTNTSYPAPIKRDEGSWNVLFKPGSTKDERNHAVDSICRYINDYYRPFNQANRTFIKCNPVFCPCDSFLYNVTFTLLQGSGETPVVPPAQPGRPGGGGDLACIEFTSNNNSIEESETQEKKVYLTHRKIGIGNAGIDPNKNILAIIDTGIDTTLFTPAVRNLIWTDPGGHTLFNFFPGQDPGKFYDDHNHKHGSAVTALALQAMKNPNAYPKIMVLKALDKDKKGSIFTVSCALSYALQKNVTLINASLGYYTRDNNADPVLQHYIELCGSHTPNPILVFAAAGNTGSTHPFLCRVDLNSNELNNSRLFYPACLSRSMKNLVSVTGLVKKDTSCFYQNYSKDLVSLGVLNSQFCCGYKVDFINKFYEGSSFATPVASGSMMRCILKHGLDREAMWNDWKNNFVRHTTVPRATINGSFINY